MSSRKPRRIVITGLPACGKTTLAHALAREDPSLVAIRGDELRYIDDKWTRKSKADFIAAVRNAVQSAEAAGKGWIYDSSEQARQAALQDVLGTPNEGVELKIIAPTSVTEDISPAIERCIGRVMGTVPQGACPETKENRARFLVKFVQSYDANAAALNELATNMNDWGFDVKLGSAEALAAN